MFRKCTVVAPLVIATVVILAGCGPATSQSATTPAPPTQVVATNSSTSAPETEAPPAPTEEQGGPITMTKWDLWAGGETTLRGVNIYQRQVYPDWDGPDWMGPGPLGPPYVQEDFAEIAATGINYVNISHAGLFTEKPPFTVDEGSQANLDQLLEEIAAADLFAVISVRTGPGRSEFTFMGVAPDDEWGQSQLNDTVWEDQNAQDAWVEMWRTIAERYKDNPVVVGYDLMVEPNSNAVFFDVWSPPDFYPAYAGTTYDWNQFYPRIVQAIREVDPDTPILVGAMSFSSVDWLPYLEPTDDPRTVYTVHPYAPHEYTHQEPDEQGNLPLTYPGMADLDWDGVADSFDRAWLEGMLAPIDQYRSEHGVPVAANEYGAQRYEPGATQYLDDVMSLFEELGINYALWSWSSAFWMQREEIKSFEARLGPDPNNLTEVVPSELWDVLTSYWSRNTLRPSKVHFVPAGE